ARLSRRDADRVLHGRVSRLPRRRMHEEAARRGCGKEVDRAGLRLALRAALGLVVQRHALAPLHARDRGRRQRRRDEGDGRGRSLLGTADHEGHKALFKVDATLGKPGAMTKSGTARGPLPAGEKFDRVVFGFDTMKAPVELVSMRLDGSDRRTLTKFNDARVA